MPPKRKRTDTDPSARKRRITPTPRPDLRPFEEILEERAQQSQSQEDHPSRGGLTPAQMRLMGLQPDPSDPSQALRRLGPPPLSPPIRPNPDFLPPPSPEDSPVQRPPLTSGTLQEDTRANRHPSNYRLDVRRCPNQPPLGFNPSPSSALQPIRPMASQMAPIGATPDIPGWQRQETALEARNNSDLSVAMTRASQFQVQRTRSAATEHATGMEIQNNADLVNAMTVARQQVQNNRAKSTQVSYHQKTQLWKTWCTRRAFSDNDIVTPSKLVLYLQEEVIPTGNRAKGKNQGAILSVSGLEGYIKPVVALYEVHILRTHF
jgi:hypothetical protein